MCQVSAVVAVGEKLTTIHLRAAALALHSPYVGVDMMVRFVLQCDRTVVLRARAGEKVEHKPSHARLGRVESRARE